MKKTIGIVAMCVIAAILAGCTTNAVKSSRTSQKTAVSPDVRRQIIEANKALIAAIRVKMVEARKAATKEERKAILESVRALQAEIRENNKQLTNE